MLFQTRFHAGLRSGAIDLTFRRWAKPQVKPGGEYRLGGTPDVLVVTGLKKIPFGSITARDAKRAGFDSIDALKKVLSKGTTAITARTPVYRVALRFESRTPGPPPRATAAAVQSLVERLARMDGRSTRGPWTKEVLALIDTHPHRRAGDLAPKLGRELPAFKSDVRKLKGMGLTRSFEVGYELTPLGRRVLSRL